MKKAAGYGMCSRQLYILKRKKPPLKNEEKAPILFIYQGGHFVRVKETGSSSRVMILKF